MNRLCFGAILFSGLGLLVGGCGSNTDVSTIQITPTTQTLAVGQTAQFTATGIISHGKHPPSTQNVTSTVSWASNAPAIATISPSGMATAVSAGTATITASMQGAISATATVTVTGGNPKPADSLVSLSVVPDSQTALAVNQAVAFVAIGTTSSGTTVNLTNQPATVGTATIKPAVWTSTIPTVATVDSATGIATVLTSGSTTITATATNPDGTIVTGSGKLTVNISTPGAGEPLVSLAIVPGTQTLSGLHQTASFVAIGTTSSGTTVNLTNQSTTIGSATIKAATWTSSSPSVATINSASGVATAAGNGATAIMAVASNPDGTVVTATATLTVNVSNTPEPLVSLSTVPGTQALTAVNQTAQLIAIGTTGTGGTVNLTNQSATIGSATIKAATWASSNPTVATVNAATGVATALSSGVTVVTAIASNPDGTVVTGTSTLTVNIPAIPEPLLSLAIVPGSQTVSVVGQKAQFIAIGTTNTGATVNLTNQSAPVNVVTIGSATWSSSSTAIATIDPKTGIAQAVSSGTVAITAVAKNPDGTVVTGTAAFTVTATPEPLVSMAIVPNTETLTSVNQTTQLIAIGTTGTGATVNLTNQSTTIGSATIKEATWASSNPSVAVVNPATGIARAVSNGIAVLTAIASNPDGTVVTGTATLSVNIPAIPEPLAALAIVPAAQTLTAINQPAQFIAIGTTSSGATVNLTNQSADINGKTIAAAMWASSSSAVATVNSATGLAKAVGAGVVAITATAQNPDGTVVTGTATFTVTTKPEPLVSLAIVPATQTLNQVGQAAQFIAIGTTASGATVNLTNVSAKIDAATNLAPTTIPPATWSSSSMAVATIDPATGLATAGTSGTTAITAMAYNPDGTAVTGTATLTVNVNPEPLVSLAVTPTSQQVLAINQAVQFIAIATTSSGATVNLTNTPWKIDATNTIQPAKWRSSNPSVAAIDSATGIAIALSAGTTAITAIANNPDGTMVTGTAVLTVTIPSVSEPLVSMAIIPASQTLVLLNQPANLKAIATTGTGTTVDLTNKSTNVGGSTIPPAVWSSSNEKVATVNPGTGVVTAITAGTTAITAIAANPDGTVVTGVATVTVTATGGPGGTLASITVIPGTQAVPWPNATTQFMAVGTTTTGATVDLTKQVDWSSSSAQIATIGAATGLATAVNQGIATITALYTDPTSKNAVTGTATFNVLGGSFEQYSGLTIIPGTQTLSSSGQSEQFIALGAIGSTGAQQDVTTSPQIKWTSSAPTIASITSSTGITTGLSVGSTTITAELKNPDGTVVSATANVTVVATPAPEPLLSLSIIPNAISIGNLQGTGDFIAIGTFSSAPYVQDVTNSPNMTWISAFPDDFPVSNNSGGTQSATGGIVTAYASGNTVIMAEYKDPLTQSIQTATATFACPLVLPNPNGNPPTPGSCYPGSQETPLKATLTVYGEGLNTTNWLVTAPSATGTPEVIHCGPGWTADGNPGGSVCVGIYPISTKKIVLTAPTRPGVAFGGWTYNCTPSDVNGNDLPGPIFWTAAGPNYCYIRLDTTNVTVGGIFNNP